MLAGSGEVIDTMSVVVNQYLDNLAARVLLGLAGNPGGWSIHLYVNLYAPTPQDTVSSYVECTLPGYSFVTFQSSQWSGGISPGPIAVYTYPQITWTFDPYQSAQQTVFGYWVQDSSGSVLYAELFPAPFPVPPQGGELPMRPTFSTEQCPAQL